MFMPHYIKVTGDSCHSGQKVVRMGYTSLRNYSKGKGYVCSKFPQVSFIRLRMIFPLPGYILKMGMLDNSNYVLSQGSNRFFFCICVADLMQNYPFLQIHTAYLNYTANELSCNGLGPYFSNK